MKQVKFRIWDLEYKEMLHGSQYMLSGEGRAYCNYITGKIRAFPEGVAVVQLFSNLKDKNGKEIYEGDIVFADETKFEVVFKHGCFMVRNMGLGVETDEASQQYFTPLYEYPDCEVIGDVFRAR